MGCADSKAVVEPNRDKTLVSTNDQNVPIIYENVNACHQLWITSSVIFKI